MSEQAETITHKSYRYYVLFVLAMTYAFSFMDRQIVSILLGDLKVEFDLNDTQLGLLSGLAFALFYSTLALPIARYADRANRVNIIAMAVGLWSLVTAFCGLVQNF
jgi:sugar phosphate permease